MSHSATEVMTTADMNVRTARPAAPSAPQRAPASWLARLLLDSGRRGLLLSLLVLSMPACIIPVGPDFRDPSGAPNAAPYITDSNPEIGDVVQLPRFVFNVQDTNGDNLHVRGIIDFPPFTQGTTMISSDTFENPSPGEPFATPVRKEFLCTGPTPLPSHQIMVIVADRRFVPDPLDLGKVEEGGHAVRATWTWSSTDCR
jgi:hypothetical protein